jgi:sugar phosphate isomerase/epimerase
MKIGAQLYSLREYCRTHEDLKNTLKRVAQIGYETVQASAICPIDYSLLRQFCDECGVSVVATHIPPEKLLSETDHVIEQHKILGCPNIGIGGMPEKYCYRADGPKDFVKDYSPVMEKISGAGLSFTYHNHCHEFERFDGVTVFDKLIELTAPYNMMFTLDVYWLQFAGINPVDMFYRLEGRVKVCHYKDLAIKGHEQRYAAIGDGNLDWSKIIEATKKTGVEYALIEQDLSYDKDIFDEMARSYNFLKDKI